MTADTVIPLALDRVRSFPDLLELLHQAKYTGAITLHCFLGVPQQAEFAAPPPPAVKIPLTASKPARRGLTTSGRKPHSTR